MFPDMDHAFAFTDWQFSSSPSSSISISISISMPNPTPNRYLDSHFYAPPTWNSPLPPYNAKYGVEVDDGEFSGGPLHGTIYREREVPASHK